VGCDEVSFGAGELRAANAVPLKTFRKYPDFELPRAYWGCLSNDCAKPFERSIRDPCRDYGPRPCERCDGQELSPARPR